MTVRFGKVIIDTNLLMQALDFKKHDVFDWIDSVYESIYIHIEVINEFKVDSERNAILEAVKSLGWTLFDHHNENSLPERHKAIYWGYVKEVEEGFNNLKEKKESQGRVPKNSNNIGEIHCIALAQMISGNIIGSNDFEIREVIEEQDMRVYSKDLDKDVLIEQDTLEDFCFYCVQAGVAKPSAIMKFFKVCHASDIEEKLESKVSSLRNRLTEQLK